VIHTARIAVASWPTMMNSAYQNYNMTLTPGPIDSSLKSGTVFDPAALGNSAVSTSFPGSWGGATAFDGFSPTGTVPDVFYGLSASRNSAADDTYSSALTNYPRIITAMQLLEEESDDGSVFCGPPSEPGESGQAEIRHLKNLGVHIPEEVKPGTRLREAARLNREAREAAREARRSEEATREPRDARGEARAGREPRAPGDSRETREPRRQSVDDQEERDQGEKPVNHRRPPPLIAPRGEIDDDNQKFICVFQIGLDDDEEFCLVKRILGKAGNNMRRIAEECSAKVRLRGIGSGFLEGSDGREANMPLQLNVSCTDFDSYQGAVDRVSTLLKDLYKHYRRYARSRGMEVPDVKVSLEEVRRDDLAMDLLSQKAQRSPSQRERDRRQREKERQVIREIEREKERKKEMERKAADGDDSGGEAPRGSSRRQHSRERLKDDEKEKAVAKAKALPTVLPSGLPVPTTPAGRRLAAKAGGAEAAAIVSAVARQQEREERDKLRKERDDQREREREERERKKWEAAERAANRAGRSSLRGKPSAGGPVGGVPPPAGETAVKTTAKGKSKGSALPKAPPPPPPGPPPADALEVIQAAKIQTASVVEVQEGPKASKDWQEVPSASKDWSGWGSSAGMKSDSKSDWQDWDEWKGWKKNGYSKKKGW